MLLRNYYNWLAMLTMGVTSTDTTTFGDGHLNTKKINGTLSAAVTSATVSGLGLGYSVRGLSDGTSATNYSNIVIGAGDTAVTFEDFALANAIYSGWTKGTPVVEAPAYSSETKKWTNTISFICTNTSGSTMTIKEVGIVSAIASTADTTSSLVYREVLATPIEITNGNSATITLNLEYTMPTV